MRKFLLAIATSVALGWAGTASAIVQTTDVTFTSNGSSLGSATVSLNFKTPQTTVTKKPHIVTHVKLRISRTGHATVRTDDKTIQTGTGMTVDIFITTDDGQNYTVTDLPVETLFSGLPINVGGGFIPMPPVGGLPPTVPPMTDGWFPGGWFVSGEAVGVIGRVGIVETDAFTGMPTSSFSPSNSGIGGGGTIGYGGLWPTTVGPLNVSFTPFASFDALHLAMNQGFPPTSSLLGETVKSVFTAGLQIPVLQNRSASFYVLGGAAGVEKLFTINFGSTVTTSDQWVWGGTAGVGLAARFSNLPRISWFVQYQHIWVEDAILRMPTASPGFDYRFSNNLDLVKFGATYHIQSD